MTDADLDRILRSADPAAHQPAPAPGPVPDLAAVVPLRASRARWVPAASAAAVVAVVGAAVAFLPSSGGGGGQPGAAPSPSVASPGGPATEKPQREHTASAGAPYERARRLLGALQEVVPDRYELPITAPNGVPGKANPSPASPISSEYGPPIGPDGTRMPAANFQAVRDEGPYDGYVGYEYAADTIVADRTRIGSVSARLLVGVPSGGACAVATKVLYNHERSTCSVVATPAGPVAVVTRAADADPRTTQWAVYRHADGTVVVLGQGTGVLNDAIPRLSAPVFSPAELAAVATDARFVR